MKQRNSSIELLRIVSMAMVLMVHFVGATFGLPTSKQVFDLQSSALWKDALESLAIVGVDCFVLISGFFGIRATWRKLLDFSLWCLFASLLVYGCRCIEHGGLASGFVDSLMIYSKTDLWFVQAYLALFIISPLLNAGFESLDDRKLLLMLLGLTFLNVYLGWWQGGRINPTGYNEMQMIFLYFLGYCMRRKYERLRKFSIWIYLAVYLAASVATAILLDFDYNTPFVLLAAMSLFMVFAKLPVFSSTAINWVSSSAFMVYLLHKNPYFWLKIRNTLKELNAGYDTVEFICLSALLFVAIYAGCILIDKVRMPICRYIANKFAPSH